MNIEGFKKAISAINATSYAYGNEILYSMASSPDNLYDKRKLNGSIWLIGRSYAASPQRRSYGTTKKGEKYINFDKKEVDRPIWPVRTSNDGRDGFFEAIADSIDVTCLSNLISNYIPKSLAYTFKKQKSKNINDNDFLLLKDSILTVLTFNAELNKAIEMFDMVPDGNIFKGETVHCNNHISFSSKFLHFYFPNIIFIVDSFAYNGGCILYNGNTSNRLGYICDPQEALADNYFEGQGLPINDYFGEEIYDCFSKEVVKTISNELNDMISLKCENTAQCSEDSFGANTYVDHCVRSYLLGRFIAEQGIDPSEQISGNKLFKPMPRLTDSVFLNIKRPMSRKEIDYRESLKKTFYRYL